jgi:hypothetical protein
MIKKGRLLDQEHDLDLNIKDMVTIKCFNNKETLTNIFSNSQLAQFIKKKSLKESQKHDRTQLCQIRVCFF